MTQQPQSEERRATSEDPHAFARSALFALHFSLFALVAPGLTPGCARNPEIRQGPVYPESFPRTATLDIHVIRRGQHIEMTNTTARPFGEFTIWLNRRFGLAVPDGLAIGQTRTLDLNDFRDQYDGRFRAGGFFATEKPEKLVLAELQSGDQLLSLVVVSGPEEP